MDSRVSDRYVMTREVLRSTKGVLYSGKDLSLERTVYLYVINGSEQSNPDKVMQQIADVSQSSDPRFVHILDMAVHVNSVYAVLEHREGSPLLEYVRQKSYDFWEVVRILLNVAKIVQDALEQKVSGFSLLVNNLFMNSRNEVMVINYWSSGNANERGIMGLLNLLFQMVTKKESLPDGVEELHDQLKKAMGEIDPETTKGFLNLIQRAYNSHESLTTFIEGLTQFITQKETTASRVESSDVKPIRFEPKINMETKRTKEKQKVVRGTSALWKRWAWGRKGKWALGFLVVVLLGSTFLHFLGKKEPVKPPTTTLVQPTPVEPANNQPEDNASNTAPIPNGVKIPDLRGVTKDVAEKSLLSLGLHYKYLIEKNDLDQGLVFKQDIAPGVQVEKGVTLTFWVSKGK
jgi:eukaryotic-like serine/threonine-protein kinase